MLKKKYPFKAIRVTSLILSQLHYLEPISMHFSVGLQDILWHNQRDILTLKDEFADNIENIDALRLLRLALRRQIAFLIFPNLLQ